MDFHFPVNIKTKLKAFFFLSARSKILLKESYFNQIKSTEHSN